MALEHYDKAAQSTPRRLLVPKRLLDRMKSIEGWLEEDEGDLLIAAATDAVINADERPCIVEIGSYCGRSTIVLASVLKHYRPDGRMYAVDPHTGTVGGSDQGISGTGPTFDRFRANIEAAGVSGVVEPIVQYSWEVAWSGPIDLLFVDGLHAYADVARDFNTFRAFLKPGSLVAFHDYASYYPGVRAFVDEIVAAGDFTVVDQARSMVVLCRGAVPAVRKSEGGTEVPRGLPNDQRRWSVGQVRHGKMQVTMNGVRTAALLGLLSILLLIGGRAIAGKRGMEFALIVAAVMNLASYFFGDKIVISMYSAQPVTPQQNSQVYARVYPMVAGLCQRIGLPMPKLWLIPDASPNAFATGRNPSHASVAFTEGILRLMNDWELEGVIAHEIGRKASSWRICLTTSARR
jgi:predicted O-methyltransferase YrrM